MPQIFSSGRYANVTATIALVVAMGGTSYAAVTITGKNIKNGSVGSVDIARNAITSAKVKNGSLLRQDFRAGQLPAGPTGPAGATGPTGPMGPAGAQGIPGTAAAKGDKGDKGDPGTNGTNGANGAAGSDAIPAVGLSSLPDPILVSTANPTAWVTVTGLTQAITVPGGPARRVLATVSGESACYGANGFCQLRILIDGVELTPAQNTDFAFDSSDSNAEGAGSWEAHSIQRYSGNLAPGAHSVTVEVATSSATLNLRFDDAVLSTVQVQGT